MRVSCRRGFWEAQFLIKWTGYTKPSYEFATEAHDNDFFDEFILENVPSSEIKLRNNVEVHVHGVKLKIHPLLTYEESRFLDVFMARTTPQSSSSQASRKGVKRFITEFGTNKYPRIRTMLQSIL
tara:strand:- start:6671 stop:7045 length:375 start_codon:yes stop_codon:yes gene_type:complete